MKAQILLLLLLSFTLTSFGYNAQDTEIDFQSYFVTLGTLVSGVILLVDVLKNLLKTTSTVTKVMSWVLGLAAPWIGYAVKSEGFLQGFTEWWQIAIVSVVVAAASNGIADVGILRSLVNFIFGINLKARRLK